MAEDIIDIEDLNIEEPEEGKEESKEETGNEQLTESVEETGHIRSIQHLSGMYQKWFLDYASYVILERAVPYVNDGL